MSGINSEAHELVVSRIYGRNVFERGKTYFREGRVLYAVKLGGVVYGMVAGTEKYVTRVYVDSLESICSCPVGSNCKHGAALLLQFLAGDYVDGDKVISDLARLDRSKLVDVVKDLVMDDPALFLKLQGVSQIKKEQLKASIEKQIARILHSIKEGYVDDDEGVEALARIINSYKTFLEKDSMFNLLKTLLMEFIEQGYIDDSSYHTRKLFESLCDALVEKNLVEKDLEYIQKLSEENEYYCLEAFVERLTAPENAKKLLEFVEPVKRLLGDDVLFARFLLNCGKKGEAISIIRESGGLDEQKTLDLLLRVGEGEALRIAEEKKFYSSLIIHYHRVGSYNNVITVFRKALREGVPLKQWPELYEAVLNSIRAVRPEDAEELLREILNICKSIEFYDLCADMAVELKDQDTIDFLLSIETGDKFSPSSKLRLLNYLVTKDPHRAKAGLFSCVEELILGKKGPSYDYAAECIIALKEIMNNEEWIEYLKDLYRKYLRRSALWIELEKRGVKIKREGRNLMVYYSA